MSDEALLVARVLFWAASVGVAILPMRWALFCLILASHIDITSLTFASATSVGFENTFRIVVLPLLLLVRTQLRPLKNLRWTLPHKLWLALTIYVAIAGSWGGFPLSAVKLVAYLAAYFVIYLILCEGWEFGWLDFGLMRLACWCILALAVLQTYGLGNGWGGVEERFTSFSTPQYFAAFLVALLAILVFSGERGFWHYATCGALVVAIVFSGSRYVFVSTVLLLIIASFRVVSGEEASLQFRVSFRKLFLAVGFAAASGAFLLAYLPDNRIDQLVTAASDEEVKVQDVGTLAWRLSIYEEIWTRLQKRTPAQLFWGSGTGSGAALMMDLDPGHYDPDAIDANRALHSEYLRALYEWGILGFVLLMAFLIATIVGFTRKIAAQGGGPALAFLGALPSILIALAIENILAGAASAGGVGILLAMSFAWQMQPGLPSLPEPSDELAANRAPVSA
jgi:O-antigen ligase